MSSGDSAPAGWRPRLLAIGGTMRPGSSSERALRLAGEAAERTGATVELVTAQELEFPTYAPDRGPVPDGAARFIELAARCDGMIISSPGFHGGPSGLLKNALDYLEELREDERPYLDGRAVACIVCAAGWQASTTTLVTLRSTVHALRAWPTPLGVAINSSDGGSGTQPVEEAAPLLELAAQQVVDFASWRHTE